jgi:hypothetical protein
LANGPAKKKGVAASSVHNLSARCSTLERDAAEALGEAAEYRPPLAQHRVEVHLKSRPCCHSGLRRGVCGGVRYDLYRLRVLDWIPSAFERFGCFFTERRGEVPHRKPALEFPANEARDPLNLLHEFRPVELPKARELVCIEGVVCPGGNFQWRHFPFEFDVLRSTMEYRNGSLQGVPLHASEEELHGASGSTHKLGQTRCSLARHALCLVD